MHRCLPFPPPPLPNGDRGQHPRQPVHQRVHDSPARLLTKLALTKLALRRKLVLPKLVLPKLVLSKLSLSKLVLSSKLSVLLKLVLRSKVGLELVDVLLVGQLLDELLAAVEELLTRLEHLLTRLEQTLTAGT